MASNSNPPHGGTLIDLLVDADRKAALKEQSKSWASLDLTQRQLCDLELLMNGGFSPLTTFLGKTDYRRVLTDMRLSDDTLWPIPICLDVSADFAAANKPGQTIALRDSEGVMLAALTIAEIYAPDHRAEGLGRAGRHARAWVRASVSWEPREENRRQCRTDS